VINVVPNVNLQVNIRETIDEVSIPMQIWNVMRVSSFFIFQNTEGSLRMYCNQIILNSYFNNFIMAIILISSTQLVIDTPDIDPNSQIASVL